MAGSQSNKLKGVMLMENLSVEEVFYKKLHKLTFAFEFIGDAVLLINQTGHLCYANPSACSMLGYSHDELLKMDYRKLKPSFTTARWNKYWQMMTSSVTSNFETFQATKHGDILTLEVVASHISHEGHAYIVEVMRDITQRKLHEQAQLNRVLEFRTLAENSPDIVVRYDENLNRLFSNPAYDKLLIGKKKKPGQNEIWCPTNISQTEFGTKLEHVMASGDDETIQLEWLADTGELIALVVKVVAEYDTFGKIISALAIGRNISDQRKAEMELRQREGYMRTLLDNFPFMVWLKDTESRLLAANTAYAKVAGVSSTQELEGMTDFDFFPHYLAQQYVEEDKETMRTGKPLGTVDALRDSEGNYVWIETYKSALIDDGHVLGTLGYARDVTDTLQREREYHSLIENSPNSIVRFDQDCKRIFLNSKEIEYYGVTQEFLMGKSPTDFPGGPSAEEYEKHIHEVFLHGKNKSVDLYWHSGDGQHRILHSLLAPEIDAAGRVISVIGMGQDVTETVENQERIHHLAYFDSLTDLPNRALLQDRLNQRTAEASRHAYPFGLMMLDLDRFKEINDTLGHAMGDALLCQAARRLETCVRSYDTVSRLGGDEFAILLSEIREPENARNVAYKIIKAFSEPFNIASREFFITASIGIAVYPSDGQKVEDLLKYADSAMYQAKRLGRNNFQFYSASLTVRASERLILETALRTALQKEEFELYYQPQVDLQTRAIVGVEALIRWHRGNSMVMPDKFIGIAEDSGLIVGIGEWVIHTACRAAVECNNGRHQALAFAVNLSTRQFVQKDLVAIIQSILKYTGCKPEWLKLEITESLLLEDSEAIHTMLQTLHDMGLCISIDDFGTGYSALSYLNRFPVSQLKIDRSFIKDITVNPERGLIVQAIISLAHNLKKSLVAEGVETIEQADYLARMGCPQAQGYLFGKPMAYAQLQDLLKSRL